MKNPNPAFVLLAEDDENDVFLLRRAFNRAGITYPIIAVPNGEEVINFLLACVQNSGCEHHTLPRLLLLDLKMPLLNGFDVLSWLHERREFQYMPTIVLSSSNLDLDIKRAL